MLPAVESPHSTATVAAPDPLLALLANAHVSLDLPYDVIADDDIGHMILRRVRDAAQRGVRMRLLIDDLHTIGTGPLLLGLVAHPNVVRRLFNPITASRQSALSRTLGLLADLGRLNHRMHNKLFIADGAVAIVGARNLANEYFLRGSEGNFIDFDLLVTGAVLPQLNEGFDLYWNSEHAYLVQAIAAALEPADASRASFDASTQPENIPAPPPATDLYGKPAFSTARAERSFHLIGVDGRACADSPDKADPAHHDPAATGAVTQRFLKLPGTAHTEMLLRSAHFIPGPEAIKRLRAAREAGLRLRAVTNSLAVGDQPIVNIGYVHHRNQLLRLGVELYELSSSRLKRDSAMRELLGSSAGRPDANMGFTDRRTVMFGPINIDPRALGPNQHRNRPGLRQPVTGRHGDERVSGRRTVGCLARPPRHGRAGRALDCRQPRRERR